MGEREAASQSGTKLLLLKIWRMSMETKRAESYRQRRGSPEEKYSTYVRQGLLSIV